MKHRAKTHIQGYRYGFPDETPGQICNLGTGFSGNVFYHPFRRRCQGRHVVAILVTIAGELFVGTNGIAAPHEYCPRKEQGFRRGEGWHLCRDLCGQSGHAEANAVRAAGEQAAGGTLLLIGHDTICGECLGLLDEAKVGTRIIIPDVVIREIGGFSGTADQTPFEPVEITRQN